MRLIGPDAASPNFPLKYYGDTEKEKTKHNTGGNKTDRLCGISGGISTDYKADGAESRIKITGQRWVPIPVRRPEQPSPVDHVLFDMFKIL